MLLIIDNYDSFTYNLYQYLCELGVDVLVKRNDAITISEIETLAPIYLVISPGPCSPNEAGISLNIISYFSGKIPILGVCLGHQAIAQVFGASIVKAREVMHGKASAIYHNQKGILKGLNCPLQVTRYHSLVIDAVTLPATFEVTAWTLHDGEIDEIMGIRHKKLPIEGVQFHPESILSDQGHQLLNNFLKY
ncbi:Aminodeoxychorismate synthase component 2 [Arsenophonus endosymbiont of Aleurodicus dispersus]|uniref:aminodeoxychorismate synthase component II n=1 Tax=Arsenophonus endosymbiont of Aleurodicus dispersus TaxID=235559 RepID=UPI000EB23C25|nr:aminodeoxychorismate synthase component II [Arsenophonus endosymbiont of Aleurodicus dispersus]VAY02245.1 Aminodeoxychorismate synthase component 2 [Arsenophonus endosymbiont of Aleurodicus dispersus]